MSSMSEANLEKKFQAVSNTQDSIQSTSLWILHHKAHCKKIVGVWMKVLKKAKIGHRQTLFYLANDVIQNGRRKGATQFGPAFSEVLKEAILLLKDDTIKGNIQRVLKIWEERNIFPSETISDLLDILSSAKICKDSSAKILAEFKPENVADFIQKMQKTEQDSTTKLAALNSSKLDAATSEVLSQLKDRSHGQKFSKEFDDATRCLEDYIKTLEKEVKVRQAVIEVLEQAEIYYDTQRGEARVVANAYKNFAGRVKIQKKKLEELVLRLPSPVPSPCADAPSPSNSEEGLELSPILEALEASPPSPVGTPDGLKMSPTAVRTDKDPTPVGALNSFLPQAPGMMTSWLDSFASSVTPTTQASSLDSRLLNFMQKLPNIPPKSGAKSTNASTEPKTIVASEDSMGATPVKDEHSGQGTPVQDEDLQVNPQQIIDKDLADDLLRKFSPSIGYSSALSDANQGKAESNMYSGESSDKTILDKDWRIPAAQSGANFPETFQSPGMWGNPAKSEGSANGMIVEGNGFDSSRNIVGKPPWNTSGSYQRSESFKESTNLTVDGKAKSFQEPLQPPPKPSFSGFDIFGSPSFSMENESDAEYQSNKSASSSQSASQSRQDPRLNSQNYATVPKGRGHGKQEADDTEPMDMDLADSDNEEESSNTNNEKNSTLGTPRLMENVKQKVARESLPEDSQVQSVGDIGSSRPSERFQNREDNLVQLPSRHDDHFQEPVDDLGLQHQGPNEHFQEQEDLEPQSLRPNDRYPTFPHDSPGEDIVPRSNDQLDYPTDVEPDDMGRLPARSNERFTFSPDGHRAKFNPNMMSPPSHDRMMPPEMNPIKPFVRDRNMFRGPMPMHDFPRDEPEHWKTGNWNRPREPPWHGPRLRFENNGHPYDEYGYNGRGGPGFDPYGPPPVKRFAHPPPPFSGRGRRGYFQPRFH